MSEPVVPGHSARPVVTKNGKTENKIRKQKPRETDSLPGFLGRFRGVQFEMVYIANSRLTGGSISWRVSLPKMAAAVPRSAVEPAARRAHRITLPGTGQLGVAPLCASHADAARPAPGACLASIRKVVFTGRSF